MKRARLQERVTLSKRGEGERDRETARDLYTRCQSIDRTARHGIHAMDGGILYKTRLQKKLKDKGYNNTTMSWKTGCRLQEIEDAIQ